MIVEIPCRSGDQSSWTQRTVLGGREYQLSFDWVQRIGQWRLTLADQTGARLWSGALVTGYPLLVGTVDTRLPTGDLIVTDTVGQQPLDPDFSGLGARYTLAYYDRSELPA